MKFTEQMSQALTFQGALQSQSANGTNYVGAGSGTGGYNMANFHRLMSIINVGTLGSSANVQAYYVASANANMSGNSNVASSIPVTITASNSVQTLEVRADQLPAGTQYVNLVVKVNTTASQASAEVFGAVGSYEPTSQFDQVSPGNNAVTRNVT